MKGLAYTRVSTEEQSTSGLGLADQRRAIASKADARGWQLEWIEDAGFSARNMRRPGIGRALEQLQAGDAQVLVVAKLDRVSRSVSDFAQLLDTASRQGWSFVALDVDVDTTTAMGEMIATVMAAMAQWERRIIGERTAAALAMKRAQGARLGAPVVLPETIRARIGAERAAGRSLGAIARSLNADGVATARGGARWHASTVSAVLRSIDHDLETSRAREQAARSRERS